MYYNRENKADFLQQILPMCLQLEALVLHNCELEGEYLVVNFPNLTSLNLSCYGSDPSLTRSIEQFLLRHRQTIERLIFYHIKDLNLAILEQTMAVDDLYLELEEPKFAPSDNQHSQMRLKHLTINCTNEAISKFLNKLASNPGVVNSLEEFNFPGLTDDLFIESLNKFQNLVSLRICKDVTKVLPKVTGSFAKLSYLCMELIHATINTALIVSLSQFRNVQSLRITVRNCDVQDCDFDALVAFAENYRIYLSWRR